MSSALTLARPYARAAFETALARSALAGWAEKLAFAAEVAADPRVVALFGNPRLGGSQLASLFLPQGEKTDGDFGHFISLLAENGRLPVLPEIGALFEQLKLESERTLKVRLRTAVRVDTHCGACRHARTREDQRCTQASFQPGHRADPVDRSENARRRRHRRR